MVNIGNMMKQAQQLQKMADAQEKLNSIEVEGVSGGGVVKVTATAKGEIKRINLDASLLKPEDKEILEDLIIAAINDAKQKGEVAAQEEMKSVTGGLPLPPGMKLPFQTMDGSAIEKLIADISKLPGLGRRSAQRIALYLLKNKDRSLLPLIQTLNLHINL